MQKKLCSLIVSVFILFFSLDVSAKVWRVNNNGYSADFTTLALANSDNRVVAGDTIHLEGSATSYAGTAITKRLVILGPGYFLQLNPATTANALSATIINIAFQAGSQGSQLQGVRVIGSSLGVNINTSNILIKRCFIDYGVNVSPFISDIRIIQNYFPGTSSSLSAASSLGFPTDLIFNNNISKGYIVLPEEYTMLECNNNVFDVTALTNSPSLSFNAGTFRNNILTNPGATVQINNGSLANVSYNVSASAVNQFGTTNNNIVATKASLFVDQGTSPDGNYQLRPGSPGTANGSDGTDRGAFGGISPAVRYTLSGLPPIPVIYEVMTNGVAGPAGLTVTVKARTIK